MVALADMAMLYLMLEVSSCVMTFEQHNHETWGSHGGAQ